eukprot:2275119-Pyramimonas_sp.AAC.1
MRPLFNPLAVLEEALQDTGREEEAGTVAPLATAGAAAGGPVRKESRRRPSNGGRLHNTESV